MANNHETKDPINITDDPTGEQHLESAETAHGERKRISAAALTESRRSTAVDTELATGLAVANRDIAAIVETLKSINAKFDKFIEEQRRMDRAEARLDVQAAEIAALTTESARVHDEQKANTAFRNARESWESNIGKAVMSGIITLIGIAVVSFVVWLSRVNLHLGTKP